MKIAICIPIHGTIPGRFAVSLARMMWATAQAVSQGAFPNLAVEVFNASTSLLPRGRTDLAVAARNWGADKILWLDADHVFPPTALIRLLARNLPVIGVNFIRRTPGGGTPTATYDSKKLVFTTPEKAKAGLVEEIGRCGLGMCLMDADLFDKIEKPWFRIEQREDGSWIGEDVWLFEQIRAAGVNVHLDHALSWESGHIAEEELTQEGAFKGFLRQQIALGSAR